MAYINLFDPPDLNVQITGIKHNLHDGVVQEFEEMFAEYVGAKYAVALNSASNAIFLALKDEYYTKLSIPSILPPVVPNSIVNAGHDYELRDDINWVGGEYTLHDFGNFKIIDSAQAVSRKCFAKHNPQDLMIFSFYPTKPIGGIDGGMIISDDKAKIDRLRCLAYNGVSNETSKVPSWEATYEDFGYKFYMSSLQAYFARQSLIKHWRKQDVMGEVWDQYEGEVGWNLSCKYSDDGIPLQPSYHLLRIMVQDWKTFIPLMHEKGIQCGKHYVPLHQQDLYRCNRNMESSYDIKEEAHLPASTLDGKHAVSLPFHEGLTEEEVSYIIKCVEESGEKIVL